MTKICRRTFLTHGVFFLPNTFTVQYYFTLEQCDCIYDTATDIVAIVIIDIRFIGDQCIITFAAA